MRTTLITTPGRDTFDLSDEHPSSRYGIPVLVVAGQAFGPADQLPGGWTAADFVRAFLSQDIKTSGRWSKRTHERVAAAHRFLGLSCGTDSKPTE